MQGITTLCFWFGRCIGALYRTTFRLKDHRVLPEGHMEDTQAALELILVSACEILGA